MSQTRFDHRDRKGLASTGNEKVRLMARSGGFVMVRRGRASKYNKPVVMSETEWDKLPLWEKEEE